MRGSLVLTFLIGLVLGLLYSQGHLVFRVDSVRAATLPAGEELELGKKVIPEVEEIVLAEFEKYVSGDRLTAAGKALVQEVAEEGVVQFLTQRTSRQIRKLQEVKPLSLNYNKSRVSSPVAMSSDGQIIVVSGSEGVLVSQDKGDSWEKVVKD